MQTEIKEPGQGCPRSAAQLFEYDEKNKNNVERLTTGHGCPLGNKLASLTAGPRGPLLAQDTQYFDEMAHFDRERIPERVVHAKGAGAFGEFEVTHDISQYCKADLFNKIGKKTPVVSKYLIKKFRFNFNLKFELRHYVFQLWVVKMEALIQQEIHVAMLLNSTPRMVSGMLLATTHRSFSLEIQFCSHRSFTLKKEILLLI